MHFVRITRDEAKEMVASSRCLARSFRRLIFFCFLSSFCSLFLSAGTERGGRRGLSRDVFNAFDEGLCDVTTACRDASVKGWLSESTRRLPREKSF